MVKYVVLDGDPVLGAGQWMLSRVDDAEWLDLGYGSPAEAAANLDEMWRINRFLGGLRALTSHLYPRLQVLPEKVIIADLGTGSADVPVALARWTRLHRLQVHILAVDLMERHLAVARKRVTGISEITLLAADADCLPLPSRSVDYVISSLFLHHFSPSRLTRLLKSAQRLARRGIVMSDLVRGRWPLLAFNLIQPIFARSVLTRHDGPLSIRRAYTPTELHALARAADLPNVRIHTQWPWRMTLVSDQEQEFRAI